MSKFSINPEAVKAQSSHFSAAGTRLKKCSAEIDAVKDELDTSLAIVAPALITVSASTRKHADLVSFLDDACKSIVAKIVEAEIKILAHIVSNLDEADGGGDSDNSNSGNGNGNGNGNGATDPSTDPSTDDSQNADNSQNGPVDGLSEDGFRMLCAYEARGAAVYDENGNLVGLQIMDVGDGKYTLGFGITVDKNDADAIKYYKEKYGIDVTAVGTVVDVNTSLQIYKEKESYYKGVVDSLCARNGYTPTQQEYDALFLAVYNRPKLASEGHALDNYLKNGAQGRDALYNELLSEYQGLDGWGDYGRGWDNRIQDELELFFDGDYERTH